MSRPRYDNTMPAGPLGEALNAADVFMRALDCPPACQYSAGAEYWADFETRLDDSEAEIARYQDLFAALCDWAKDRGASPPVLGVTDMRKYLASQEEANLVKLAYPNQPAFFSRKQVVPTPPASPAGNIGEVDEVTGQIEEQGPLSLSCERGRHRPGKRLLLRLSEQ